MSFCEFAQLYKESFSSQLEVNHVIQQPTEVKKNKCRPSCTRVKFSLMGHNLISLHMPQMFGSRAFKFKLTCNLGVVRFKLSVRIITMIIGVT